MGIALRSPVRRYLDKLELALKAESGLAPEEALSDAREHLQNMCDALLASEPGLTDDEAYAHILETFGEPAQVAKDYAGAGGAVSLLPKGYAPGWRISCTRCGRSAPAANAGIVRIGAWSWHKYILGYCRDCQRLRWLRLTKDLHKANLSAQLGADKTPQELRRAMHRPWLTVALILAIVIVVNLVISFWLKQREAAGAEPFLQNLPPGWQVSNSFEASPEQRAAVERKLGGKLQNLRNTKLAVKGQTLQINSIQCATEGDAQRIYSTLVKGKPTARLVQRQGETVIEFVVRTKGDMRLAMEARYRLGIQPQHATYRVQFDAAPLQTCDCMQWNKLFNLFLQYDQEAQRGDAQAEIARLSQKFQFADRLSLRRYGLGAAESKWTLQPLPEETGLAAEGELYSYQFAELPKKAGLPVATVIGEVSCTTYAPTPGRSESSDGLLASTARWPVDNPQIRSLAEEITGSSPSSPEKVQAILKWLADAENLRYGGDVVGSRYGVEQTIRQGFGHCWDFSDVFVTLCRARGVPCRQVIGWLYGESGHVWAEVLVDDQGWRQVDPTAAMACGSDYIPFAATEDGEIPLVYLSDVRIEIVHAGNTADRPPRAN